MRDEPTYRRLFQLAADAMVVIDGATGTIDEVNPATCRMLGYEPDDFVGKTPADFARDRASSTASTERKIHGDADSFELERQLVHRDGHVVDVWIRSSRFTTEDGRVKVLTVARDITESKRLAARLKQISRIEALGSLAGGIAHDFNNTLAIILGNAELELADRLFSDAPQRRLETIIRASRQARDLVRQILTFSRAKTAKGQMLAPARVVHRVLDLIASTLPGTVCLERRVTDELPSIRAEEGQLHQILINLVGNARQALPENRGTITVELSRAEAGALEEVEAAIRLTVRDDGAGMPPEVLERIFDPYFTTRARSEGTGLGLSTVYGIVKANGGSVAVESEPARGTTLTILWPAHEPPPRPDDASARASVLVVDDDPTLVELYEAFFTELGWETCAARSRGQALEIFDRDPKRIDVVLTDYSMPGGSGEDLCRDLRERRPTLPVVLLTGQSRESMLESAQSAGFAEVVEKPCDLDSLHRALRALIPRD